MVEVECSAGTYVRALARDLGAALGSAAYLGALVRTASGPFHIEEAVSLDALRAAANAGPDALQRLMLPPESGLERFPRVALVDADVAAIARGQFVSYPGPIPESPAGIYRLIDGAGRLVAIARVRGGRLAPDKVLIDAPVGSSAPIEDVLAAERDPSPDVDPDPVTPDDA
jgi:tRNA pseudouridine55 synthase